MTTTEWTATAEELPALKPMYKNGPRSSGWLLGWNGRYVAMVKYEETFVTRKPRWTYVPDGRLASVSHWAPLPEGPKQ